VNKSLKYFIQNLADALNDYYHMDNKNIPPCFMITATWTIKIVSPVS
jgi:hypothetical protein